MNESFILKTAFSFREKLSYITHAEEYKGISYKLWTICKLIASCGKCDLLITPSKAKAVKDNNGQCIFSRKVTKISDQEGGIQPNFLCHATGNKTNQQSEAEINIGNKSPSINTEINPANKTHPKKEENIIEEKRETPEEVTTTEVSVDVSDTTSQEEKKPVAEKTINAKETQGPPTSNSINNAKASQYVLIAKEYEELHQHALNHINSTAGQNCIDTEKVVRDILRLILRDTLNDHQPIEKTRSTQAKEQLAQKIKGQISQQYQNREDLQCLLEFSDKCVKMAWDFAENDIKIAVSAVPQNSDQDKITKWRYNFESDSNDQTNTIRTVIWPALHDRGDPAAITPIIAKGWAKVVNS